MRTTVLSIGLAVLVAVAAATAEEAKPGADQAAPKAAKPAKSSKPAKAAPKAAKEKPGGQSDEQIADQLKAFCVKWMGFLETREHDNQKAIKWDQQGSGVSGHYVGYSKEYDC